MKETFANDSATPVEIVFSSYIETIVAVIVSGFSASFTGNLNNK